MKISLPKAILMSLVCLALLATGTATIAASEPPQPPSPEELTQRLQDKTADAVTIATDQASGLVSFIGTDAEHSIGQAILWPSWTSPEAAARQFLGTYGSLFGLQDQAQELTVKELETTEQGRSFVRFQQVYEGIPVLAGELIVQTDASRDVLSSNGEVAAGISLDTTPQVSAAAARDRALELLSGEYDLTIAELEAGAGELWIYNPSLLGAGPDWNSLVWRFDVTSIDLLPIRELVLIDAEIGRVALHFNQIDYSLNRRIYDNVNNSAAGLPGTGPVRVEGGPATGIGDADDAYDYTGATYAFYSTNHSRDSIDNAGLTLTSTVRYCPSPSDCPFVNAYWNGEQMVFGDGLAVDDVVGHELTHGVTEYESGLFYYMQSGAINEAFSDIWGEFVDQTYTNGNDLDGPTYDWLVGEDIPVYGPFRSMEDPTASGNPDKMSSSYYYCGSGDLGGVHSNSGVGAKAAYLMVAGDTFNTKVVTGIGIPKTAVIWYEVQTNLTTSGGDYEDLYYALQQACANKIGTIGITPADCVQVKNAVDAVEMNQQPSACAAPEAQMCQPGQTASDTFFESFETGAAGWTPGAITGGTDWYLDNRYATDGVQNIYGWIDWTLEDHYIQSPGITIPAGAKLYFDHATELRYRGSDYWDGGSVEYSISSGPWLDAAALFVANGPNGTVSSLYSNPLAGRQGFVGGSNGYISSRADLSSLAGQNVRFRWRLASSDNDSLLIDNDNDDYYYYYYYGWFVDNIHVYTCSGTSYQIFLPLALRSYPAQAGSWVTIMSDDFEDFFPGFWSLWDGGAGYQWAKSSCRPYQGSYSAWAIGDNTGGADPGCGANYSNDLNSWMYTGPFSLADAQAAEINYSRWLNSESGFDKLCVMASIDDYDYYGTCYWSETSSWADMTFDLSSVYTLGDLSGQSQVWIAFIFESNASVTYAEGAHVDNVVLRKCTAASCDGGSPSNTFDSPGDSAGVNSIDMTMTRPE